MSWSGPPLGYAAPLHYNQTPRQHAPIVHPYHEHTGMDWCSGQQRARQMPHQSLTLAPFQSPRYTAPRSANKNCLLTPSHVRSVAATERIAISNLVDSTPTSPRRTLGTPSTSKQPTFSQTDSHFPYYQEPVYFQPAHHFPPANRPLTHNVPAVTSFRHHQPGGTLDYRLWKVPEPDKESASRPSSNGEGPSRPRGNESESSVQSPASSFGRSITALSPLFPPASPSLKTHTAATEDYDFNLIFRQQPIAARACGLGDRDRRTIDPPPILELKMTSKADGFPVHDHNIMVVLLCELREVDGGPVTNLPQNSDETRQVTAMMGNYVASPFAGKDELGLAGTFFILSDLSCRYPGKYRLHFTLLRMTCQAMRMGQVATTTMSEPFTAYTAKDFPGMRESTPLLKQLRRQGLSVGIKKGSEARKQKSKLRRLSPLPDQDEFDYEDMQSKRLVRPRDSPMSEQDSPGASARRGKKRRREV